MSLFALTWLLASCANRPHIPAPNLAIYVIGFGHAMKYPPTDRMSVPFKEMVGYTCMSPKDWAEQEIYIDKLIKGF